jgi:hypothetical protein
MGIAKETLNKKSNAIGIIILNFKLHYSAIAIKTAWFRHKADMKTNGTEDLNMNPCSYVHLIFDKGTQNI